MARPPTDMTTRFWRYVKKKRRCWEWVGCVGQDGYGKFQVPRCFSWDENMHTVRAHRLAWFIATGEWPAAGKQVLHKCDNPLCVRFSHLRLGTHQDNMRDMVKKGRSAGQQGTWNGGATPETAWQTKLSWKKARRIREEFSRGGVTKVQLGLKYGVTDCTIRDIVQGRTWKE